MKKITPVSLGLFFAAGLFSSAPAKAAPSLGVQAGVSVDSATAPANISRSSVTGLAAGLNVHIPFSPNLSLQPELLYVQRGVSLVDRGGISATAKYDSIELPVFAKVGFGGKIRPYLFAGPVAIWNVSKSIEVDAGGNSGSVSFNPRTFDFAATAGVGLDVGPLFANVRYSLGVIDIDANSANWKSRGIQFLLGVQI